jgi:flagellum-specific ATP synthase/type III secretion protein N (ATPase)
VDAAIQYRQRVLEFLQQRPDEISAYGDTYADLLRIAEAIEQSVGGAR